MGQEARDDDNVVEFPRRDHAFANAVLEDRRLNVTSRLAWLLTTMSADEGHTYMSRAHLAGRLKTDGAQLRISARTLIKWRLFRCKRVTSKRGVQGVQYHPVLEDGEDLWDFSDRLRADKRLDLCTRLHWRVCEMTEDGVSEMAGQPEDWDEKPDTFKKARDKLKTLKHFEVQPGNGRGNGSVYTRAKVCGATTGDAGKGTRKGSERCAKGAGKGAERGDQNTPHNTKDTTHKKDSRNASHYGATDAARGCEDANEIPRSGEHPRCDPSSPHGKDRSARYKVKIKPRFTPDEIRLWPKFKAVITDPHYGAFRASVRKYGAAFVEEVLDDAEWVTDGDERNTSEFLRECFHRSDFDPLRRKSA